MQICRCIPFCLKVDFLFITNSVFDIRYQSDLALILLIRVNFMAKRKAERSPCKESAANRIKQCTIIPSELNLLILELRKLLLNFVSIVGFVNVILPDN